MICEDIIIGRSEKELWTHRHQLKAILQEEIGSSTMDLVDELLTVERELVRREKFLPRS
jgi:hypothetical protein